MIDLGTVKPGSTIRAPFSTFDKDDGSSITATAYTTADMLVYKNGSTTERASASGYTATTDFDAKTGKQLAIIDLSDNTTADFWNAGAEYLLAIDAITVDAVTTGGWIARWRIGYPGAVLDTTIATLATQTSFTLTAGPAEDDALNGCVVVIHDIASAVQAGFALITDYTGATKTVTLAAGTTFTAAAGDNISVMPRSDLSFILGVAVATGTAQLGVNVVNVGGSAVSQSGGLLNANVTQLSGDATAADNAEAFFDGTGYAGTGNTIPTVTTLTNLPAITANWLTAAGIAASALNGKGDWNIGKTGYSLTATTGLGNQTANITGNLSGSVGSVTGAVGSVTGAVGSISGITFPTNFGSLGINVSGHVSRVVLCDTITTYTGNTLQTLDVASLMTTALTESYAADGANFTPAQAFFQIWSMLSEFAISGTTLTAKKKDGTTTSMTFTLDSATSPTSITRAS